MRDCEGGDVHDVRLSSRDAVGMLEPGWFVAWTVTSAVGILQQAKPGGPVQVEARGRIISTVHVHRDIMQCNTESALEGEL